MIHNVGVPMPGETLAPSFAVDVNGSIFDLTDGVESVEFESADGIADLVRIIVVNPDFVMSQSLAWLPGNEVSVYMGYHGDLRHVSRVRIYSNETDYPRPGQMPKIEVVGYDLSRDLMSNEPDKVQKKKVSGSKTAKKAIRQQNAKLKASEGRVFNKMKLSDMVSSKAADYGLREDIDPTPGDPTDRFQKAGMTDYQFVQALANYTGFVFWIDGDRYGTWTLHFKDPTKLTTQTKVLKYEYNSENANLQWFRPVAKFMNAMTKLTVETSIKGKPEKVEFEINPASGIDTTFTGNILAPAKPIKGPPSDVILSFGGVQARTIADRRFSNTNELKLWAKTWFRMNAQDFVFAEGETIGDATLMARQTHTIEGCGKDSGDYYFTRVNHRISSSGGYQINFDARRVIKGLL